MPTRTNSKRNATRNNRAKRASSEGPRTLTTLAVGILIGVFATLLAQLYLRETSNPQIADQTKRSATQASKKRAATASRSDDKDVLGANSDGSGKKTSKPPAKKPKFDFYEILEQDEVKVDEKASPAAQSLADDQEYILQVASFRTAEDADRLRAELLLLNLEARSQKAVLDNGDVWHRVIVGPFPNQSKVAAARSTLLSNRHDALLLKRKR